MNINPMQLIQMIKGGMNPQQLVSQILPQFNNIPVVQNAYNMMQNRDIKGLEQIARNLSQQRGIDFDTEYTNFKNSFK